MGAGGGWRPEAVTPGSQSSSWVSPSGTRSSPTVLHPVALLRLTQAATANGHNNTSMTLLLRLLCSLCAGPEARDFSVESLNPQNLPARRVLNASSSDARGTGGTGGALAFGTYTASQG